MHGFGRSTWQNAGIMKLDNAPQETAAIDTQRLLYSAALIERGQEGILLLVVQYSDMILSGKGVDLLRGCGRL